MYCEHYGERVDEDDCYECGKDCKKNQQKALAEEKRAEELNRLKGSELADEIKGVLSKSLNLDDDRVNHLICDLFDGAFRTAESQLTQCLNDMANKMAVEYVHHKAKAELDKVFDRALGEKILLFGKDEKAQETKIQTIIINKIKKFFEDKQNNTRGRNSTQESIDKAIESVVDQRVTAALEEITKESIDKFNKAAMKKMMAGMVGAIQNDKRLLAVLAPD